MRPITKGNDPPYNPGKTTFTFGGGNIPIIKKLLNIVSADDVPIINCLALWLSKVKGDAPPNGATDDEFKKGVAAIQSQVGDNYKLASVFLTQRLGPFCSFCETPLPGLLEVEHRVPKAVYPTFSLDWTNFLLACSPCNTAKGNKPPRAEVQGWLNNPTPTEQQYYDEIVAQYVWPDLDSLAFERLPVAMQFYNTTTAAWALMRMDMATNVNNQILTYSIGDRRVTARIYDPEGDYRDLEVRAVVLGEGSPTIANRTVDMLAFNEPGNAVSTYDRRMLNRTLAWFTCLNSLSNLMQAGGSSLFWNQMLATATATGFYSVWVEILKFHENVLANQFVVDTNVPLKFPGTNTTNLP